MNGACCVPGAPPGVDEMQSRQIGPAVVIGGVVVELGPLVVVVVVVMVGFWMLVAVVSSVAGSRVVTAVT